MDFALFQTIVEETSRIGVRRVRLYLHGEPMLHPRIVDMLNFVRQHGMSIQLMTNGMLFDQDRSKKILDLGLTRADRFIFSILGHSRRIHERIQRGVDHDQVMKNVQGFLDQRQTRGRDGPAIEVVFYAMPENQEEVETFRAYWRPRVDHVHINRISNQFATFNEGSGGVPRWRTKTCTYLWERMTVFWNGEVTTCIADLEGTCILGALGKQTIQEIWNGEQRTSLQRLHRERRFRDSALCSLCDW